MLARGFERVTAVSGSARRSTAPDLSRGPLATEFLFLICMFFTPFVAIKGHTSNGIFGECHGEHMEVPESGCELEFRLHLLRRYRRTVCPRPSTRVCALLIVTAG
jgi:hypothetical protein